MLLIEGLYSIFYHQDDLILLSFSVNHYEIENSYNLLVGLNRLDIGDLINVFPLQIHESHLLHLLDKLY